MKTALTTIVIIVVLAIIGYFIYMAEYPAKTANTNTQATSTTVGGSVNVGGSVTY